MVQGSLRCIGSGTHLKRMYGKGYKLTLTCPFNEPTREKIHEYFRFQKDLADFEDFWSRCWAKRSTRWCRIELLLYTRSMHQRTL